MKLHLFQFKSFTQTISSLFTTCLLISLPLFLAAQSSNADFQKVPIEVAGETFNTFYAIAQDQEGYIWLGTNHGLLRYDGYEAKVYRHHPKDSTTIGGEAQIWDGSNPIYLLYVDMKGDLWAGTSNDLSRYSVHCDCFVHYRFPHGERINAISEDENKNLWIGVGKVWRNYQKPFLII